MNHSNKNNLINFLIKMFFILISKTGYTFTVSPMNLTLDCASARLSESFELKNSSDHTEMVHVSIAYREMNHQGVERIRKEDSLQNDFFIFPPQLILPKNSHRKVRLAYKGSCQIPEEIPLRVIFEQLPYSEDARHGINQKTAKLNIRMKYLASVYLRPAGVKSDLQIKKITTENLKDGRQRFFVHLINQGKAHELLSRFQLSVFSAKISESSEPLVELHEKQLQEFVGQNFFPGSERIIELIRPMHFFQGGEHRYIEVRSSVIRCGELLYFLL